jgi:hypothetical protein
MKYVGKFLVECDRGEEEAHCLLQKNSKKLFVKKCQNFYLEALTLPSADTTVRFIW